MGSRSETVRAREGREGGGGGSGFRDPLDPPPIILPDEREAANAARPTLCTH